MENVPEIIVVRERERKTCAPGHYGLHGDPTGYNTLPPFSCTSCGEDCDPFEWQCSGCTDWVCSRKCMDEHVRRPELSYSSDGWWDA